MARAARTGPRRLMGRSLGLLLILGAFIPGPPSTSAPSDEYSWDRMEAAIQNLRTDDNEVKRDIAQDAYQTFAPLFDLPPGRDEMDARRVVDDLRHWVRVEKDEWISTSLLRDLDLREDEVLDPLFADALSSQSPNLRWAGIRWFKWREDGDVLATLEDLWPHEDRPWVQADLIAALALRGSMRRIDDFLDLTASDDPALAQAAIEVVGGLMEPRAVPVLTRIARSGPDDLRAAAVDALAPWSDEPPVLELLLDLSRTAETTVRGAAIRTMGTSTSPLVGERLKALALSSEDTWLRAVAADSLTKIDPGASVPVLLEILHRPATEDDSSLRSAALRALMDIDDPSVLEAISDLDVPADRMVAGELETLRESLARDRETKQKTIIISSGCSLGVIHTDPSDPRTRVLVPPPDLRTLRCWEGPGVAGDPEENPRLEGGSPIAIEDHFELAGESWASIRTRSSADCWVPLRFIESAASPRASQAMDKEDTMVIRREFDLPVTDVESDVAQGLMDAGLLEVIEPGDEVIGVAITIDPGDFDRLLLLARSCGLNETILDGEIYEIVADLAPLYRGHPVLDRFRRAPRVQGGETDEVIDLDVEKLSD